MFQVEPSTITYAGAHGFSVIKHTPWTSDPRANLQNDGWQICAAFASEITVSQIWRREAPSGWAYRVLLDRSGFDGLFRDDDWAEFPRYELSIPLGDFRDALRQTNDPWVLCRPLMAVAPEATSHFHDSALNSDDCAFPAQWRAALNRPSAPTTSPTRDERGGD